MEDIERIFIFLVFVIGVLFGLFVTLFAVEIDTDVININVLDEVCNELEEGTIYKESRGTSINFKCVFPVIEEIKEVKLIQIEEKESIDNCSNIGGK